MRADNGAAADLVRHYAEVYSGAQLDDWTAAADELETVELAAGEVLFDVGEEHPYIALVREGSVKLVTRTPRGREIIVAIGRAGDLVASLRGILPAPLTALVNADLRGAAPPVDGGLGRTDSRAVAITPSVILRMDIRRVRELMLTNPAWALAAYHAIAVHALSQEKRARDLLTLSAETRYRQFLADFPELIGVLPQKDIASYLGVTPVGLSRIAGRVRESARG